MPRSTTASAVDAWRRLAVPVRDAVGALALLVLALLPLGVPALQLGDLPSIVPVVVATALTVVEVAPLALRRVLPAVTLAIVGAAFAVAELVGAPTGLGGLGLLVALYSVAAHQRRGRIITAGAAIAAYAALCFALHLAGSPERLLDWITFAAVLALPWLLGETVRRRNAAEAERIARAADDAVRAQRTVLARELHDVVTHHVTAMVVQSESGLYLGPTDLAERDRIFAEVGETGRLALTDLRTLLDALDPGTIDEETAPRTPGHDIATMIGRLQRAGYPIELDAPDIPLPDDERGDALHGVIREALTNAMKHARGMPVSVRLRVSPLELHITNPLPKGHRATVIGDGRGLAGMALRIHETGGEFDARAHHDSIFVVSARWPS